MTHLQDTPHPLQIVYQELQRRGHAPVDLDSVDGRAFADAYLDGEPNRLGDDFRATMHRLTAGSPLFTAELVRSMQERGDLVRNAAGAWEAVSSLSWEALPARVEAVIGRRLAQLSPSQRALLATSSVQGERFIAEVTASVLERPAVEVTQDLSNNLEHRHHLVLAEGVDRIGGTRLVRYRFRHALFQQYLYAQLDAVEQVHAHEAVARNLEAICADHPDGLVPIAGELAWHCWRANLPEEAIAYHIQAGNWAVRLSANVQAQDHFERGIALLERVPGHDIKRRLELELLTELAAVQSMRYGGASPQVQRTLERARSLDLRRPGNEIARFRLLEGLWEYHFQRGEIQESCQLAELCLEIAEELQSPDLLVRAHCNLGSSLYRLGRMESAQRHIALARELGDAGLLVEHYMHGTDPAIITRASEALVLWYLGFPEQAEQRSREAIAIAEEQANTYGLVFALIFACGLYLRSADAHKTLAYADRTLALCVENRFSMWEAAARHHRAWALAALGDCKAGSALLEQALSDISRTGLQQVRSFSTLADVYARCGRVDAGLSLIGQMLAKMDETDEREWEPEIHRLHGELRLAQNDAAVEMAESRFLKAIEVAREQQSRTLELRAVVSLCKLRHKLGGTEPVRSELSELYAWFTEGFDTPDLIAARHLLSQLRA